jgi:hypothetical protein
MKGKQKYLKYTCMAKRWHKLVPGSDRVVVKNCLSYVLANAWQVFKCAY